MADESSGELVPAVGRVAIKSVAGFFGPLGAAAGAIVEEVWNRQVRDLEGRQFSFAERLRVEDALRSAAAQVEQCLNEGRELNADWFVSEEGRQRASADEVLEGSILAAAATHEDRKAEFIGNLMGRAIFDSELSPAEILFMLQMARELSYRQLVILALVVEGAVRDRYDAGLSIAVGPLAIELDGVYRRGLIASPGIALHPMQQHLHDLEPTDNGRKLYELMVLSSLDQAHKAEVIAEFDVAFAERPASDLDSD
jgi:hypothetical protein